MKLTTGQILAQVRGFWQAQSKRNQKLIIIAASSVLVIAIVAAVLLNRSGYVVLYSGVSSAEMGEIASRLNEMGVDFKTTTDGNILVPSDEEATLQMTLASEGYPHSTLSYDIFSANSGFMTTDYEKKKYLLFQLQNRLQDAIKTIRGIKSSIVTISLPDEDSFVLEEDRVDPSASVVLALDANTELTSKQIQGIENLVAKSVPGLTGSNVAIVDDIGEMLNEKQADTGGGSVESRLELEKGISSDIEKRVAKLLTPIFGDGQVRIAVNTLVDINKKFTEQTTYLPAGENGGIIANQDVAKEGAGTSGTSSSGGVPGSGSNMGVTSYAQGASNDNSGNYSESSSVKYLNNQLVEQIERNGYEISDITVSVLIDKDNISLAQKDDYRQMVAFAAGIAPEKVAITNAVFAADAAADGSGAAEGLGGLPALGSFYWLIAGALVFALAGFLTFLFIKKKLKKKKKKAGLEEEESEEFLQGVIEEKKKKELLADGIVLNETREQNLKRQIKDFSSGSPDIVAQLIRTWIKEGDDNE